MLLSRVLAIERMVIKPIIGKTCIVTGGGRGIGLGLAQSLQEKGNNVIATVRTRREHAALRKHNILETELDTNDLDSIKQWVKALRAEYGIQHVDVLINNAGIYGKRLAFSDFMPEDFIATLTTNTLGPFFVVQQLHNAGLIGGAGGSTLVVNMSSIMASHGDPPVSSSAGGGYAYRASKAALNIINKSMAVDLSPEGINSVLIHPGYVSTDMTEHKGWISVEESVNGIFKVLESRSVEDLNGRFLSLDGSEIPW